MTGAGGTMSASAFGPARSIALAITMILIAGCASETPKPDDRSADEVLGLNDRAARLAFQQGQYRQATRLFREVLADAYKRDDLDAIVDAQYNAAASHVKIREYDPALELLISAKGELSRRGRALPDDIGLLESTVLYRQGDRDRAATVAQRIAATSTGQAGKRAQFLLGLIAADRGNTADLRAALAHLGGSSDTRLQADRAELAAYLHLLEGRYDRASAAFLEVAARRTADSDYRGTMRSLAAAGESDERAGRIGDAAGHFLRAGRSAAAQEENGKASTLLQRALELGKRVDANALVNEAQALLEQVAAASPATQ